MVNINYAEFAGISNINTSSCSTCRPFKSLLKDQAADNCVVLSIDNEPVSFSVGMLVARSPEGDLILVRNGRPLQMALIQAMRDEFSDQTGPLASPTGAEVVFRSNAHGGGLSFNATSNVKFYKPTNRAISIDRRECQQSDIVRGDHVVVAGTSVIGVDGSMSISMNELTLIHRP